jgi:hypothetical protein
MPGQDAAKPLLALQERQWTQIRAGAEHQIKDAIEQLGLMTERVLEQLKVRHALAVERYQLAIQNGVYLYALQRLSNLNIAMADDLAVAAVKRDPTGFDAGDHAEAVVLVLENPSRIIKRSVSEGSQLKPLRKGRRARHGQPRSKTLRNVIE